MWFCSARWAWLTAVKHLTTVFTNWSKLNSRERWISILDFPPLLERRGSTWLCAGLCMLRISVCRPVMPTPVTSATCSLPSYSQGKRFGFQCEICFPNTCSIFFPENQQPGGRLYLVDRLQPSSPLMGVTEKYQTLTSNKIFWISRKLRKNIIPPKSSLPLLSWIVWTKIK